MDEAPVEVGPSYSCCLPHSSTSAFVNLDWFCMISVHLGSMPRLGADVTAPACVVLPVVLPELLLPALDGAETPDWGTVEPVGLWLWAKPDPALNKMPNSPSIGAAF